MADIFGELGTNKSYGPNKSWSWFQANVRKVAEQHNIKAQKFLGDNQPFQVKSFVPGEMIMFFYDPKYKAKLPYYDTFPLTLPFSKDETGFTALNLHYLHPRMRLVLFDKLLKTVNDDSLAPNTKMKLSWELLGNSAQFPEIKGCIKRYLFSHVKSTFLKIPPKDWLFATFLPLENFKKADNARVWSDTRI